MKPTNPLWYLAAFLLALGGAMIATVVAASAWDPVRDATVTSVTSRIDASGKTLAVFTDIVQTDRDITCRATDRDKKVTEFVDKGIDIAVDSDGNRWHLLGIIRNGSDGLKITCRPKDRRTDNASYGYAAVTGYDKKVTNGTGIAVLALTAGVGFAAYVFYCRRARRKWAVISARESPPQ